MYEDRCHAASACHRIGVELEEIGAQLFEIVAKLRPAPVGARAVTDLRAAQWGAEARTAVTGPHWSRPATLETQQRLHDKQKIRMHEKRHIASRLHALIVSRRIEKITALPPRIMTI